MTEEIIVEAVPRGKQTIFVVLGVSGAIIGGYLIYRKFFAKKDEFDDGEREVAYTYEDAVAKAKARLVDSGKDDGVKLAPSEDKPALKGKDISNITFDEASYKDIVKDYADTDGDDIPEKTPVEEEKEPEKEEPSFTQNVSKYTLITEEIFRYENPFHLKNSGEYSSVRNALFGWNNDYDELHDEELVDILKKLCADKNHADTYWFSCDEDAADYEIEVI